MICAVNQLRDGTMNDVRKNVDTELAAMRQATERLTNGLRQMLEVQAMRHRTICSNGFLSNKTALAIVFKLVEGAQNASG